MNTKQILEKISHSLKSILQLVQTNKLICSNCTESDRARIAVTILDGNALCGLCFARAKPNVMSRADFKKMERLTLQAERAQMKNIPRSSGTRPKSNRWLDD